MASTIEEKNIDKVKNILQQVLSKEKGTSVMRTIAEKFIDEGIQKGERKGGLKGAQQGLQLTRESIEMVLEMKFGTDGLKYMEKIRNINDIEKPSGLMKAIKIMKEADELDQILYQLTT